MINTVVINSDGTVDVFSNEGLRNRNYSGDWDMLHTIMKNLNVCINGRPSILPTDLQFSQNTQFYFSIAGISEERMKIPYSHVTEMIKFIKTDFVEDSYATSDIIKKSHSTPKPENTKKVVKKQPTNKVKQTNKK